DGSITPAECPLGKFLCVHYPFVRRGGRRRRSKIGSLRRITRSLSLKIILAFYRSRDLGWRVGQRRPPQREQFSITFAQPSAENSITSIASDFTSGRTAWFSTRSQSATWNSLNHCSQERTLASRWCGQWTLRSR